MKRVSGKELQLMPDNLIEQMLSNKIVSVIFDENSPTEKIQKGRVEGFYCYSVNDNNENTIAGISLRKIEDITFSDNMIIEIEG